ncbi:hypothetical protein SDC9_105723 [bioreactor metagenome]|uniref:Uncharacterized protein n=1 Tax=bioreactor metagenome TaxID=1076179 RepID=A0A645B0D4_9ZZZZ
MGHSLRFELRAEFRRCLVAGTVPIHAHDHRRHNLPCFKRVDQLSGSRAACRNGGAAFLHDRQCAESALDNEHRRILIQRLFVEQRLRPGVLRARFKETLIRYAPRSVILRFRAVRYDDRVSLGIKSKPKCKHTLTSEPAALQVHLCSRRDSERLDALIDVPRNRFVTDRRRLLLHRRRIMDVKHLRDLLRRFRRTNVF